MATRRIRDILILGSLALIAGGAPIGPVRAASGQSPVADEKASQALKQDWLGRWERHILADARNRYCDKEPGEEIGWRVSPFENGFLEGYEATHETMWLDLLVDWGDSWIARGAKEPDGFIGWPKPEGASTSAVPGFTTDNMLGEAMGLRPLRRDFAHDLRGQPQPRELGRPEHHPVVSDQDGEEVIEDAWLFLSSAKGGRGRGQTNLASQGRTPTASTRTAKWSRSGAIPVVWPW